MPLPSLIEIVPLERPVKAQITVPGSKSITNRAMVLAALAGGETVLQGALWSEDTQVMAECLQKLGFTVSIAPDASEPCNRVITIRGHGGKIPQGNTSNESLDLFVGNAGTAARFLAALVCLGRGTYRISGVPRMRERPQAPLFRALRQFGCRIDTPNDRLPAIIHGAGPHAGHCAIGIEQSSQFASALLLCSQAAGWQIEVTGQDAEETSYVSLTAKMLDVFPKNGGSFLIEPDCSSGSYFVGASVEVRNWPHSGWQMDEAFPRKAFQSKTLSRSHDLGDSIMTAIALAPFAAGPVTFTDLGRLRLQECERVQALRAELARCGAKVSEDGDTLTVFPSSLRGADIETYNDHRMAMCFAVVGLKAPGIRIKNPACVKKTFPNFFQKLAGPPPAGLGAVILDAHKQPLNIEELFAD
jgi:3-phosphoshikimate 1-carboxyvinyltransferase